MNIQKVGVIGAGVMGASIAAHITNAGIPVTLLDIVPEGAKQPQHNRRRRGQEIAGSRTCHFYG